MKSRFLVALLSATVIATGIRAADEPEPEQKSHIKDALRAKLAEEAKKKPATPAPAPASATATQPAGTAEKKADKTETPPAPVAAKKEAKQDEKSAAKTAAQPATVLPKMEVKKGRITVLDQEIAKQEQDIAREKKNLKPTETELALNDMKVAKPASIFGGESAQFRQRVASERVELMEAEKDILEAMKLAKTQAEKDKLQKELDQFRAMRRDLEKSLR
jgi:hypothetical protein